MEHAATVDPTNKEAVHNYTKHLRASVYDTFKAGEGTRDLAGPEGNTTEKFCDAVAERITHCLSGGSLPYRPKPEPAKVSVAKDIDTAKIKAMFSEYDTDGNGQIDYEEFQSMIIQLGIAPKMETTLKKRGSLVSS